MEKQFNPNYIFGCIDETEAEMVKKLVKEIRPMFEKTADFKGKEIKFRNTRSELAYVRKNYGNEMALRYQVEIANEMKMPMYHLKDTGEKPEIVNVYEKYPNAEYGKLKFLYERGYVWLVSEKKGKLFMDMHCITNKLDEIVEYRDALMNRRGSE